MFTFTLSNNYLSDDERSVLTPGLAHFSIDENIWDVFACLFRSSTKGTTPLVLRVFENRELCGAAIVIKCRRYGKALFNNPLLAGMMDLFGIPCHLWIKFGCCMDTMSNSGFVADPTRADELLTAISAYLRSHTFLTIINDFSGNGLHHAGSVILPALPHARITTREMDGIGDFLTIHKSLKRKPTTFRKNGGTIDIKSGVLPTDDVKSLKRCFRVTAGKSSFYLPYQDLYFNATQTTGSTRLDNVYYFIARLDGKFVGYQAALKTGTCLNALHGAFDRTLRTTHHAYDCLILKMVEFAIENECSSIDYGAVLNETKQRLMESTEMSYFLGSRWKPVTFAFSNFLKVTKIQGRGQMKYRETRK
jgi:hypothetical protein